MASIRSFIAAEIDIETKQKITALISELKKSEADVKWLTENKIHITLKFLGDIETEKIDKISAVIKNCSGDFKKFAITLSDLGCFPDTTKPRVVWIGIANGKETLKSINTKIENELENIGIKKESRDFKAHITLGRVRSFKNTVDLTKKMKEINLENFREITVQDITLYQSTLTPKGAVYSPLETYEL